MNWEKIPCHHCGMNFENLHERCHVASTAEVKTELNSQCFDGALFDEKDDGVFVMDSVAKELLTGDVEHGDS